MAQENISTVRGTLRGEATFGPMFPLNCTGTLDQLLEHIEFRVPDVRANRVRGWWNSTIRTTKMIDVKSNGSTFVKKLRDGRQ